MSYILDALRKADAQRERDPARGIHAQPVAMGTAGEGARAPARSLLWGALAVGVGALAFAGWQLLRQDPAAVVAAAPAAMAPPPAAAPTPAPRPVDPPAAPAAVVMPPAPPMPPPPRPAPVVVEAPVARAPAAAPAAPQATPPAPAASAAILASAPPDAPKLAVTGGVYSSNKAQRMLIVNGQVFNEGAEPVPGVILEQIRPNVAVMNYRGQRYMVNY